MRTEPGWRDACAQTLTVSLGTFIVSQREFEHRVRDSPVLPRTRLAAFYDE